MIWLGQLVRLVADEQVRKKRWKERDGELFDQYFEIWSAQEIDFIAREKSSELATYLLDTTVT